MPKNMKFHAIALISICAIVFVVYSIMGTPQPVQAPAAASGKAMKIYTATWGENCNSYVDTALEARATRSAADIKADQERKEPVPQHAVKDNVLELIAKNCDGQETCIITPNSEKMGFEPLKSCSKVLSIGYRCHPFKPLTVVTIEQDRTLTIDCSKDEAPAPATK